MSTPPTATQLAAMKREAKQRAKGSNASYNATLEVVAREYGFDSWFAAMQLHKAAAPVPAAAGEFDLVIDPVLPDGFDDTPNEERSADEIERWWLKPFAHVLPDGRYEVRCLDGGAWDRSTWYGIAQDLESARALAKAKLAKWREFLDKPVFSLDNGCVALTVDSLWPDVPRAVLASFDSQTLAVAWLKGWDELVANDPELMQAKLERARAQALASVGMAPGTRKRPLTPFGAQSPSKQAEQGRTPAEAAYVPTESEMAEQYAVLSRIALLEKDGVTKQCETPDPLRADIQRCVDLGFVMAVKKEADGVARPRPPIWQLTLSPTGRELLELYEEHLRETGQK